MTNISSSLEQSACPRFVAVGAGRMGRGIALAFAYAGYRIALVDLRQRSSEAWDFLADDVHAEIEGSLVGLAELGVLREEQISRIAARIELVPLQRAPVALRGADLVFECVPETMQVKRDTFDSINRYCKKSAIVTSTTSSIPVTKIARYVSHRGRFLNMHWLNPAYLIPIVELSCHPETEDWVLPKVRSIMESIGKLIIVCGPSAGYIVPRLQTLVMNEAARIVEEGLASAEEVDKATRYGLGLRFSAIGVLEFIDFGGCDILYHANQEMSQCIDKSRYKTPKIIENMMRNNRLGLKSSTGFYSYKHCDFVEYRKDVLSRTVDRLRNVGLLRSPAD